MLPRERFQIAEFQDSGRRLHVQVHTARVRGPRDTAVVALESPAAMHIAGYSVQVLAQLRMTYHWHSLHAWLGTLIKLSTNSLRYIQEI